MKLVWHIAAKDLRRLRLTLGFWAVVLVAKNEIGVSLLRADATDLAHFDLMHALIAVLSGLALFANVILVALLVHEDAVTGTRAFWMTRPMSGARLLAGKLLGALLMFGALPILLSLRFWLVAGFGLTDLARAALLLLDEQVLVVGVGFAVASLTEEMKRFLLGLFVGFAGLYFWLDAAIELFGFRLDGGYLPLALIGATGVVATATLIWVRFRRGPRWHAFAAIAGGLGVATALVAFWRPEWQPMRRANVPGAERIEATVTRAVTERDGPPVRVGYVIANVPDGYGVRGRAENSWQLSPRPVTAPAELQPLWPEWANWQALGMPPEKFSGEKHRASVIVFRDERARGGPADAEGATNAMAEVGGPELERLRVEPVPFTAHLQLTLFHPVLLFEIRPETGAVGAGYGWRMRVASASVNNGQVVARFVASRLLWQNRGARFGLSSFFRGSLLVEDEVDYFKVDRAGGQIRHLGRSRDGVETLIGGVAIHWQTMTLDPPDRLRGVTLAALCDEDDGALEREVKLPQLIPEFLRP